ncbi:MAG: hypothetical protein AKCLJLPJ_01000 [Fimbriimonadales bacterium]|nr:MAG: DUF1080 domain-containing protein [Armatimonadota bacterium]MBV6502943.1 hypothetical protein [Fimbriimonadales bacterium]MCE7899298.1 DUF1080 domain-containing protein [Armatimonadetes bacterium ATM1]MDL1927871.1 DUF1080 domain-containing protein [Fimbriimonadia bacterium ATM]MBC6969364.1 DUF1080 domain-containing protein [Armatimonadota bacterium]
MAHTAVPVLLAALLSQQSNETISLFDGKTLEGWTPKIAGFPLGENYKNTFRVENGAIKVSYDGYENFDNRFGHLFYKTPFSYYILKLEYRFTGKQVPGGPGWAVRNSGVMLHCQPPQTMGKDQSFPVSIEIQFLGGDGKEERATGNVCTPGTHVVMNGALVTQHCINSTSRTYHGDQWVRVEVEVHGGKNTICKISGATVIEFEQPQLDPNDPDANPLIKNGEKLLTGGYIALQSESHPVEFRNITITKLKNGVSR